MAFYPVSDQDGSWAALKRDWENQCSGFREDFAEYASVAFSALDPLAALGHPRAGIYALQINQGPADAICQLNRALLPGYDGHVVRVRFVTFAPKYDFGDISVKEYGGLLAHLFVAVIGISNGDLLAPHVKFHLPSPADRQFFAILQGPLSTIEDFSSVEVTGSWLYVTKSQ